MTVPDRAEIIRQEYEELVERKHTDRETCRAIMIAGMFIADAIEEAGRSVEKAAENIAQGLDAISLRE